LRRSELLESGAIVGHGVGGAVDVGALFCVAVMTLVDAGGPAEVGASALGGEGTFVFAREGGSVVLQVGNGVFPDVEFLGHNVGSCQHGGLLDVTVGEVPIGVAG
jgi:hypothetical protein